MSAFCTVAPTDNDSSVFPTAEEAKVLEEEESKTGQSTHTWSSLGLCMHQGAAVCFLAGAVAAPSLVANAGQEAAADKNSL